MFEKFRMSEAGIFKPPDWNKFLEALEMVVITSFVNGKYSRVIGGTSLEIPDFKTAIDKLKSQITVINQQVSSINSDLDGIKSDVEQLKTDVTTLKTVTIPGLQDSINNLTGTVNDLIAKTDGLTQIDAATANTVLGKV